MWVTAFLWSADTNLCTLFFVWVSQSAGERPARASNHWSACLHVFFSSSPLPLSFAVFPLTLQLIIFPSHICSFSIDKWVHEETGGEKKKRHKLSKSYWPTLPDLALGIHISAKEFQEQFFFLSSTPLSSWAFSAGGHFPHIKCLIPTWAPTARYTSG